MAGGGCDDRGPRTVIDGIDIGAFPWRRVDGTWADVITPQGGARKRLSVYTVTDGTRTVTVAAGEVSNTIWGVYVPVDPT